MLPSREALLPIREALLPSREALLPIREALLPGGKAWPLLGRPGQVRELAGYDKKKRKWLIIGQGRTNVEFSP
jgi:hypothetical protein